MNANKKSLLFVLDDINYPSGARQITANQIAVLSSEYNISVFSLSLPDEKAKQLFASANFLNVPKLAQYSCLNHSFANVILGNTFSFKEKLLKVRQAISILLGRANKYETILFRPFLFDLFQPFDAVITVSEASKFRRIVAELTKPVKIQWIHTDYTRWRSTSKWARQVTKDDKELYKNYNYIVLLNKRCKDNFISAFPEFNSKALVIKNYINVPQVRNKANEPPSVKFDCSFFNIVTIGRLEQEKNLFSALEIAEKLKAENNNFKWYIVGDGSLFSSLKKHAEDKNLMNTVIFTGMLENPISVLKQADLFVLPSSYEGTPVTIIEALLCGVPVVATNVGGIAEQLQDGYWGQLVEPSSEAIYTALKDILTDGKPWLYQMKNRLSTFEYQSDLQEKIETMLPNTHSINNR